MRKHHKEDNSGWKISFRKSSVRGRRVQLGGATPDGKIPFPLMTKGERFIRCKGKFLEKEHRGMVPGGADGHRGSMSDMNSVLHQSVSINAKGGDC
jgi:hypothetical protein